MKQSDAETIGTALADAGFDFAATLPADQLHALQAWVSKSQRFQTVAVTNEGEGVAICAGAWLAGKMPVIILETSGILLSTYALMRCHATFGIPTLDAVHLSRRPWRSGMVRGADRRGAADLLEALSIPCKVVSSADEMAATFVDARRTMSSSLHPVSIVMDVRLTTRD